MGGVAYVTAPLVSANASHRSRVRAAAEQRAPTTAVDTASVAQMPILSTTSVKRRVLRTAVTFPRTQRPQVLTRGVFTGRGSSTNSAIAMPDTKVTTAHCANVPKATTQKPTVKRIGAQTSNFWTVRSKALV